MSIFFQSQEEVKEQQKKFYEEFSKKVENQVLSLELAELRADRSTYREFNISSFRPSTWGLLVFCKDKLFYYISEQDSYMSFFVKGAGHTEEKTICLSDLTELKFYQKKTSFFSFLNPETARTIDFSYINNDGNKNYGSFVLTKKSSEIIDQISSYGHL